MRLLHHRHGHGRRFVAAKEFQPERSRNHQGHERECLPLWHLPPDCCRHPGSLPEPEESMKTSDLDPIELERYELREQPLYRFKLDRRRFFKVLGCGMVVLLLVDPAPAQESGGGGRPRGRGQGGRPSDIAAWLHIGEDGTITVFTGKTEVGQNIRTSLTQAIAEELHAPVSSIKMVMAD